MNWVNAITLGGGGTRAARTQEEAEAWRKRVLDLAARADAAMVAHGASRDDLTRPLPHDSETLRAAARAFFATLTPKQREAMAPLSRGGEATAGTVMDYVEGLWVNDGFVMCHDELVPIAEVVWPELTS